MLSKKSLSQRKAKCNRHSLVRKSTVCLAASYTPDQLVKINQAAFEDALMFQKWSNRPAGSTGEDVQTDFSESVKDFQFGNRFVSLHTPESNDDRLPTWPIFSCDLPPETVGQTGVPARRVCKRKHREVEPEEEAPVPLKRPRSLDVRGQDVVVQFHYTVGRLDQLFQCIWQEDDDPIPWQEICTPEQILPELMSKKSSRKRRAS